MENQDQGNNIEEIEKNIQKGDHLSIEVVEDHGNLLSSIQQKMESIPLSRTITRIPQQLSKGNEQSYNPTFVSIGPLHHDKHCLKSSDDQKWRYFDALLSRETNPESTVETCISSLRRSEQKARIFYGGEIEKGSDQFIEMMLLDGCFIIEIFLEYSIKSLRRRDDPFFSSNDGMFNLRCDLILYENQLPFFVLDQLFHLIPTTKQCSMSLTDLSLHFFNKLLPKDHSKFHDRQVLNSKPLHFLDLIRQYYLPTHPQPPSKNTQTKQIQIHQATRISSLGIRIERAFSESPSNITFFHQKLKIPSLEIHSYTEILFRNFIAMELCQPKCPKQITSYVVLMGQLMQSKGDVRLLQHKDILINGHYTEWEILLLFKRLFVDINVKDFYYRGICEKINGFQRRREVWWENMRDIYHGTPFGVVGFCLVVFFLVLIFVGGLVSGLTFILHHFR